MIQNFSIENKDFSVEMKYMVRKLEAVRSALMAYDYENKNQIVTEILHWDIRGFGYVLWDIVNDLQTIYDTLYPETP